MSTQHTQVRRVEEIVVERNFVLIANVHSWDDSRTKGEPPN